MSSSEALHQNRTILSYCRRGQYGLARRRFEKLLNDGKNDNVAWNEPQLYDEVFQVDRYGYYPIHLVLLWSTGGTNGDAHALILSILEFSKEFPSERRKMLSAAQINIGRTPLHLATCVRNMEILDALVRAYPEALLILYGERTPLEISKQDYPTGTAFLEEMTASWIRRRLRMSVHLCANRYFRSTETPLVPFSNSDREVAKIRPKPWFVLSVSGYLLQRLSIHLCANRYFGSSRTMPLVPFSNSDRKVAKIKPKPWFVLSVIGYLLQREMKPIALQILAFVGGNAKVAASKKRRRAAPS